MHATAPALPELDFFDSAVVAASEIAAQIATNVPINRPMLITAMTRAYCFASASEEWSIRDAYDVLELRSARGIDRHVPTVRDTAIHKTS